jgi:hypothetical protein
MRGFTLLVVAAVAGLAVVATAPKAEAQVSVNIGYYGPEWFSDGVFIGVGPWFHGPANFHGYVDNHFHPDHGYKGPTPARGEKAEPARRVDAAHFHGNEMRDGRGHVVKR